MALPPLILASASPRRRALLQEHGYTFSVEVADVQESAPPHLTPGEITLRNARAKAHTVARKHPEALVLGVDTEVVFAGEVFGKPADLAAAFAMVKRLNGQTHAVYSGVWLCSRKGGRDEGFIEISRVHFRRLTDAQIRAYHSRIEPLDKAGAYAAQDDDGELIARIEGSFTNVIGLPMEALAKALRNFQSEPTRAPGSPWQR